MLANVFSNTTAPRVEKAEGVPLLGLALKLCLMAAIAALAFVASRHFNNITRRLVSRRAISTGCVVSQNSAGR